MADQKKINFNVRNIVNNSNQQLLCKSNPCTYFLHFLKETFTVGHFLNIDYTCKIESN